MISLGLLDAFQAWQSGSWPETAGTVTSATVQVSHGRRSYSYTPRIAYAYSVSGVNYSGTSITPGRCWRWKSANAVVNAFPAGSHPRVYYSPADPRRAVLMPRLHFYNFSYVIFGLIPLTLGGTMGSAIVIARIYGIPPNPDGSYSLDNSTPGGAIFMFGFIAFFVEIGLAFWVSSL